MGERSGTRKQDGPSREAGQVLILLAAGFIVLLAILGLALDLGLMYVERIKLGRACDAAALAAAQELPYASFAARRAIQYLDQNGYDASNAELIVVGPSDAATLSHAAPANSIATFTIDTESYEDPNLNKESDQDNSPGKIRVAGRVNVDMYFMQFLGFDFVPVAAHAVAENASNVDVVLVYDQSDSMNDDTYCYAGDSLRLESGAQTGVSCYVQGEDEYPLGERLILPYTTTIGIQQNPLPSADGHPILVAEAEFYSYSTSYSDDAYYREYWELPTTFWTLQRVAGSQASGYNAVRGDMRGAHMMHLPHRAEVPGHSSTSGAPRLDYDFVLPASGSPNWYVWLRAQCGAYTAALGRQDSCLVHVGINGAHRWSTNDGAGGNDHIMAAHGGADAGSIDNEWVWVRFGPVNRGPGNVQVNVWGGGSGFRLDKILLTTHPDGPVIGAHAYPDQAPAFIRDLTPAYPNLDAPSYETYEKFGRYGGPGDTGGRTGSALDECNPIYGRRVEGRCDNTVDDMFDDEQPLRAAQEAAKHFVERMRAHHDQLGFIAFSRQYDQYVARELQCLLTPARGGERMPEGEGICDPETGDCDVAWTWCFDHRLHDGGTTGPRDSNTTSGSVIRGIEDMTASLETNTGDGMREALDVLFYGTGHYGRTQATKVMIVLSDGVANRWPTYDRCPVDSCCAQDLYQPNDGTDDENRAADCVIYYAQDARAKGVVIFTIGLGIHADQDLLREVADMTGGLYYYAPKAQDVDWILQQIADQILLRLVE